MEKNTSFVLLGLMNFQLLTINSVTCRSDPMLLIWIGIFFLICNAVPQFNQAVCSHLCFHGKTSTLRLKPHWNHLTGVKVQICDSCVNAQMPIERHNAR